MDPVEGQISVTADTSEIDTFSEHLGNIGDVVAALGIANIAQQFLDLGTAIVEAGFQAAAGAEQMSIAFGSAFGSGAGSILTGLDQMSYKTPLLATQLDNMALKLNTAGIPAKDLGTTLSDIANIASGTGTSMQDISQKSDVLTQSLARAEQFGRINSLTLRPLISNNIPIVSALVKVINDAGGSYDQSSTAAAKNAKTIEEAQTKHTALEHQLADEQKTLQVLNDTHFNYAKANINSQKTLEEHAKKIDDAKYKIAELNNEIAKTNVLMQAQGAAPITAQDLLSNSKNITITAQQLQEAYKMLGEGKYAGDAQKQADTLNGTLKNLQSSFLDLAKGILGVGTNDQIVKGGVFDTLRKYALEFFNYIQAHKADIENWFKTNIQVFVDYVVSHQASIESFFKTMVTDLGNLGKWYQENQPLFNTLLAFIAGTNTLIENIQFLSSSQGLNAITGNLAASPILPFLPGGGAAQAAASTYQNTQRTVNITMHNTVNTPTDWNNQARQIGWQVNHR